MENFQHVLPVRRLVVKTSVLPLTTSSLVARRGGMSRSPVILRTACSTVESRTNQPQLRRRAGAAHREAGEKAGFRPFKESLSR